MTVVKTQGTGLYFVSSEEEVMKLTCPTGLQGVTAGQKSQIPTTCLEELEDETYISGLGAPGTVSVPFNFHPDEADQQELFALKASGDAVGWYAGLSDGTAAPTLDSDSALVAPAGRSGFTFNAYVADVDIDIATNEIVRGTLTLQRSGSAVPHWKTVV